MHEINPQIIPASFSPHRYGLKRYLLFAFVFILLFQNSIALLFATADIPTYIIKLVFIIKEALIPLLLVLIIIPTFRIRNLASPDKWAIIYLAAVVVSAIYSYTDMKTSIMEIKFYMYPMLLYLIGRHFGYSIVRQNINKLMLFTVFTFICFSFLYYGIGFGVLQDLNVSELFKAKGARVSDQLGVPWNFYSHFQDHLMVRCVGPFFDPLTAGFFSLLLLSYYRHKKKGDMDYIIFSALILSTLLTLTRAIIGSFLITLLFTRVKNGKYVFYRKALLAIGVVIAAAIILNLNYFLTVADPSSWGHLYAYKTHIGNILTHPLGVGYFRLSDDQVPDLGFIPTESIYLTMALENGIPLLLIFAIFLYSLHRYFSKYSSGTIQFVAYTSLIGYFIASLTTEHLFALTSCGLFWLFLGFSIADAERHRRHIYLTSAY
jgi:hypothetical protein